MAKSTKTRVHRNKQGLELDTKIELDAKFVARKLRGEIDKLKTQTQGVFAQAVFRRQGLKAEPPMTGRAVDHGVQESCRRREPPVTVRAARRNRGGGFHGKRLPSCLWCDRGS